MNIFAVEQQKSKQYPIPLDEYLLSSSFFFFFLLTEKTPTWHFYLSVAAIEGRFKHTNLMR
jgi:hypothetical protein